MITDNLQEGRQVKKDEVLVELDSTSQELDYLQAQRGYDLALINGLEREIKEAELTLEDGQGEPGSHELYGHPLTGLSPGIWWMSAIM